MTDPRTDADPAAENLAAAGPAGAPADGFASDATDHTMGAAADPEADAHAEAHADAEAAADAEADADPEADAESAGNERAGADVAEADPEPPGGADAPETAAPTEDLRQALADAEQERDSYLDQLRRARADYENLNKRKTRELMEALDRGAAQLCSQLIGVLDNFGFALDAARGTDDERLAKGVEMVHTELTGVLRRAGLEEVPGVGAPFDPTWHEALMQVEAEEPLEEPLVEEVLRTGYRFKGRVLRPASVKVAR